MAHVANVCTKFSLYKTYVINQSVKFRLKMLQTTTTLHINKVNISLHNSRRKLGQKSSKQSYKSNCEPVRTKLISSALGRRRCTGSSGSCTAWSSCVLERRHDLVKNMNDTVIRPITKVSTVPIYKSTEQKTHSTFCAITLASLKYVPVAFTVISTVKFPRLVIFCPFVR